MKKELTNFLNKNRQNVKLLLSNLIKIKSYSNQEKDIVKFILNYLSKKLDKKNFLIKTLNNNILVVAGNKNLNFKKPKILFDAHLDTVPAESTFGWKYPPFKGEIKADKVYGRGSCDDKGSVCALIFTLLFLKEISYESTPVAFSFSANEEDSSGKGIETILKYIQPSTCIICEPSNLEVVYGHKGKWSLKITFFGKSAHSSTPHLGKNAIYESYSLIKRIIFERNKNYQNSELGEPTCEVTYISSKTVSLNTIPHECSVYIDYRSVLGETEQTIKDFLLSGLKDKEFSLQPQHKFLAAWILDKNHKLIQTATKVYKNFFNTPPKLTTWLFCTNGSVTMVEHKIPTIGFGPGNPFLAHKNNEYIKVSNILKTVKFYVGMCLESENL